MKLAFAAMCVVLAVSLALCMLSMYVQGSNLKKMEIVCDEALSALNDEDVTAAVRLVDELDNMFDERSDVMEMLASHNDLHDTRDCIVDAKVALECEDKDDAYQALTRLKGMIAHLRDHEKLTLANLL